MAGERHFIDHIAPVWRELSPAIRGTFWTHRSLLPHALARGVEAEALTSRVIHERAPLIVAAFGELRKYRAATYIFMEHGAGQSYDVKHTSYIGGGHREPVGLFLAPNRVVLESNQQAYPRASHALVGNPRLDRWAGFDPGNPEPVVCISFHWDCKVVPETRSAWTHFYPGLRDLAKAFPGRILGHAHPRLFDGVKGAYVRAGIEPVRDFEAVLARADVYGIDNSSTLFEFAATGRPVVVLNAPWYRRNVTAWPRFWWGAKIGPNVDYPIGLADGFRSALERKSRQEAARAKIVSEVFPNVGHAAADAARAIEQWWETR